MSFSKPEVLQNTPGGDAVNQSVMKNDANIDDVYTNLNSLDASKAASSHSHGDATTSADGFMSHVDKLKLDGIEEGASVGMSGAEIKVAYEAEPDTNAYTDADKNKLSGVESGATADQTASQIKSSYESNSNTNAFTDADKSKLSGVESGATADQTASQIKSSYESNSNTNAFTDADKSKLSGVEAGATADQTAAQILALLLTVDSDSSGLNATTLQGHAPSYFAQVGGDATQTFKCEWPASDDDAISRIYAEMTLMYNTDATVAATANKIVKRNGDGDIKTNTRLYFDDDKFMFYSVVGGGLYLNNGAHTYKIDMTSI